MASTQTAAVGGIRTSRGWGRIIVGIAIGALLAGTLAAWLATQDGGVERSATVSASVYSLSKVLEQETMETFGTQPAAIATPQLDGAAYSMHKLDQIRAADASPAASSSSAYGLAKLEQVRESSTRPVAESPRVPGLVE